MSPADVPHPPGAPARRPPMARAATVVVVTIAALLQLALGWLTLVSGLAVPGVVVLALLLVWGLEVALLVVLARRRPWWTPAVPVGGFALWAAVVLVGGELLGWTA